MKIKVQVQHLQPGDIVGSGEKVIRTYIPSIADKSAKGKIGVQLIKGSGLVSRSVYWSKYTQISVERASV